MLVLLQDVRQLQLMVKLHKKTLDDEKHDNVSSVVLGDDDSNIATKDGDVTEDEIKKAVEQKYDILREKLLEAVSFNYKMYYRIIYIGWFSTVSRLLMFLSECSMFKVNLAVYYCLISKDCININHANIKGICKKGCEK